LDTLTKEIVRWCSASLWCSFLIVFCRHLTLMHNSLFPCSYVLSLSILQSIFEAYYLNGKNIAIPWTESRSTSFLPTLGTENIWIFVHLNSAQNIGHMVYELMNTEKKTCATIYCWCVVCYTCTSYIFIIVRVIREHVCLTKVLLPILQHYKRLLYPGPGVSALSVM